MTATETNNLSKLHDRILATQRDFKCTADAAATRILRDVIEEGESEEFLRDYGDLFMRCIVDRIQGPGHRSPSTAMIKKHGLHFAAISRQGLRWMEYLVPIGNTGRSVAYKDLTGPDTKIIAAAFTSAATTMAKKGRQWAAVSEKIGEATLGSAYETLPASLQSFLREDAGIAKTAAA